MESREKMEKIVSILDSKKADDIKVLKIGDLTILGDYFVIATGNSSTQVKMLADEIDYQMGLLGIEPHNIEGYETKNWILLDYYDVVVHVFYGETRDFYGLERLWADGEPVDISHLLTD